MYTESEVVFLVTAADSVGDAGVIGVLHQKGIYDNEDELYLVGVGRGCFPWPDSDGGGVNKNKGRLVLDFHDLSLPGGRAVFCPEAQRMLMEEFYPPLDNVSVPGNVGALEVGRESVEA